MSLNYFEDPTKSNEDAENGINVEEGVAAARGTLDLLQSAWEAVPARDESFLARAEELFMAGCADNKAGVEGYPESINGYFSAKRRDLKESDSSRRGHIMAKVSGDGIEECKYAFLGKILESPSPEEVCSYAEALLDRVSRIISDSFYNRDEVRKIRNATALKSYNMFGYDNQKTTETLENLSQNENSKDEKFLEKVQDYVRDVKATINTLVPARLQQLQGSKKSSESIETLN